MELTPSQFNRLHDIAFALFERRLAEKGEKMPKTQNQRYGRGQFNAENPNLPKDIQEALKIDEHSTIYLGDRLYRLFYELNKPRIAKLDESDLSLLLRYLKCEDWNDFERKYGIDAEDKVETAAVENSYLTYYIFYYYQKPSIRKGLFIHNQSLRQSEVRGDFLFPKRTWQVSWVNAGNNVISEMSSMGDSPYLPRQKIFMLLYAGGNADLNTPLYSGIITGVGNEGTPVSAEILVQLVTSEAEALRLLDIPPDNRITLQLLGNEIKIPPSVYETLEDLPSSNMVQILQKMAGVYKTYFLDFQHQRLIQLVTMVFSDGIMEIQGPAVNYKGYIKPVNGGGLLRARALPTLESNPAYTFELVMMNDFDSFAGVYSGVSSSHTPRSGRIICIKEMGNEPVNHDFFEIGTPKYLHFLAKNPKVKAFLAGENGDNYVDNFHLLSTDYTLTHFYAACFLAKNSPEQALQHLKTAFSNGFRNTLLLKKETAKNGALANLAEYIDLDSLQIIENQSLW
ncbi:MAG: hypothetical protein ACKVTZ_07430 [Bacteroidia bacterium]